MPKQPLTFSAVKGLVVALDSAVAEVRQTRNNLDHHVHWVSSLAKELQPTRWTAKIEAALDKPQLLQQLSIQYDEQALMYLNFLFRSYNFSSALSTQRDRLLQEIKRAVQHRDKVLLPLQEEWLGSLLEAAVVRAIEEHRVAPQQEHVHAEQSADERGHKHLSDSFEALALTLHAAGKNRYPSEMAVHPWKAIDHRFGKEDWRRLQVVEYRFEGDEANAALLASLEALSKAGAAADRTLSSFKQDKNGKGGVNERQYASRLIEMLPREGNGETGATLDSALASQNERRWQYELIRQAVVGARHELDLAREHVSSALNAAVVAVRALQEAKKTEKYQSSGLNIECSMLNCLVADVRLRSTGRAWEELGQELAMDVSDTAGARALTARYLKEADFFRRYGEMSGLD
ncbi:MAG TPA: hypothetical protein V6C81_10790 [Planktothrix sp.]|jgi:hypothetical protein